jgi:integrase
LDREYITDNPFIGVKFLKIKQKRRKVFTKVETKIIMNYLKNDDLDLLLAISFCYYCALSRTEMRKLKIENIDLTKGLILLDGYQTKNKDLGSITMTQHFLDYLNEIRIKKYPAHFYVFGKGLKPGPLPCNQTSIPDRHRAMIKKLNKFGILPDIEGKTFYSWKDTAARDMIEEGVSAPALQKHFRHSSLETTQRYLESFGYCNDSIRDLKSKLF